MREQVRKCLTCASPPCKGIRIPESGKFLFVGSGIRENFDMESGIQGVGIQNRAEVPHYGMKSRIEVPLEKTGIQHPESRIQDCLVFANMGR